MNSRVNEAGQVMRDGEQVEIGGNYRYVSLCRKHYLEGRAFQVTRGWLVQPGHQEGAHLAPSLSTDGVQSISMSTGAMIGVGRRQAVEQLAKMLLYPAYVHQGHAGGEAEPERRGLVRSRNMGGR